MSQREMPHYCPAKKTSYEIHLFLNNYDPSKNNFVVHVDCESKVKKIAPLYQFYNDGWGQKMNLPAQPGFFGSLSKTKILSIGNMQKYNLDDKWYVPTIEKGYTFKTEDYLIDTSFRKSTFGKKFELKRIFLNNFQTMKTKNFQNKTIEYEIFLEYCNGQENHVEKICQNEALTGKYSYASTF